MMLLTGFPVAPNAPIFAMNLAESWSLGIKVRNLRASPALNCDFVAHSPPYSSMKDIFRSVQKILVFYKVLVFSFQQVFDLIQREPRVKWKTKLGFHQGWPTVGVSDSWSQFVSKSVKLNIFVTICQTYRLKDISSKVHWSINLISSAEIVVESGCLVFSMDDNVNVYILDITWNVMAIKLRWLNVF